MLRRRSTQVLPPTCTDDSGSIEMARGQSSQKKHNASKLVWFEETNDVTIAIAREKQVKNWRRKWKLELIEAVNPHWSDLSKDWYGVESYSESSSE